MAGAGTALGPTQGRQLPHIEHLGQVPLQEAPGGGQAGLGLGHPILLPHDGEVNGGVGEILGELDPGEGGQLADPRILELPPLEEGGQLALATFF